MATKKSKTTGKSKRLPPKKAQPQRRGPAAETAVNGLAPPVSPDSSKAHSPRPSALNAAATVLAEATEPMTCQEMIALMAQKGLWNSPAGKTPAATLYTVVTMLPKAS